MVLVTVQGALLLDEQAATAWFAMERAARDEYDVDLTISSPTGAWRSPELVLDMYRNKERYGIPASQPVAKPRSLGGLGSVHEAGRSIDVWNHTAIARQDLVALANRFGFRFPIATEPWHMQLVRQSVASIIRTPIAVNTTGEEEDMSIRVIAHQRDDGTYEEVAVVWPAFQNGYLTAKGGTEVALGWLRTYSPRFDGTPHQRLSRDQYLGAIAAARVAAAGYQAGVSATVKVAT